jgi:uncharacterized coiled-coil DUF342 family protein
MSTDLPTTVATAIGSLLAGGGLVAIINAFAKRRTVRADAAARLSDETLKWVNEFQDNAKEARAEAALARQEATEAHAQMRAVRSEAEWLAGQLQQLRRAILDPQATIERLRAMVGPDYPNGTM